MSNSASKDKDQDSEAREPSSGEGQNDGQGERSANEQEQEEQQDGGGEQEAQQESQNGNGLPEWITFFVGLAIVLLTMGTLTYLHFTNERTPPEIQVIPRTESVRQTPTGFYLPVELRNLGGETAEDVGVDLTLTPPEGEPISRGFTIRFLASRESDTATVVFPIDPREGTLEHTISFFDP